MKASPDSDLSKNFTPIYKFIIGGVVSRLRDELGMPIAAVTSTDKIYAVKSLFRGDASKITYPFATVRMSSIRMSMDRGAVKGTALRGNRAVISNDELTAYNVQTLPVDYSITLSIYTNDQASIVDAACRLMFARILGALNVSVQYGHVNFSAKVEPPDTYDLPERQADADQLAEYTIDWELLVHSHLSYPQLRQVQIADKLVIDSAIESNGSIDVFDQSSTATPSPDIVSVDHPPSVR